MSTSPFYLCFFFNFDTCHLFIERLVIARGAELVGVVMFLARREEGGEEVALAERV